MLGPRGRPAYRAAKAIRQGETDPMSSLSRFRWVVLACPAFGCATPEADLASRAAHVPGFIAAEIEAGEDGRCYGRDITPAVIQTITEQVLVQQASYNEDGTLYAPARYESNIRQVIEREREEVAFETLCPPAYTPEFVSSLQRALRARGFYAGEITGAMDAATGRAVQDYQRRDGPDSPLLWIASARELGLVELSQEELDALNAARR